MEELNKKRGRPKKSKIIPTDSSAVLPISDNLPEKIIDRAASDIDRVASVTQKEEAMAEAGVTRVKVYRKIQELLDATKTVENIIDGEVVKTEIPDVAANAKGAELALKAFNDLKEFDKALGVVTHNKVVYQWLQVNNTAVTPSRISND